MAVVGCGGVAGVDGVEFPLDVGVEVGDPVDGVDFGGPVGGEGGFVYHPFVEAFDFHVEACVGVLEGNDAVDGGVGEAGPVGDGLEAFGGSVCGAFDEFGELVCGADHVFTGDYCEGGFVGAGVYGFGDDGGDEFQDFGTDGAGDLGGIVSIMGLAGICWTWSSDNVSLGDLFDGIFFMCFGVDGTVIRDGVCLCPFCPYFGDGV